MFNFQLPMFNSGVFAAQKQLFVVEGSDLAASL